MDEIFWMKIIFRDFFMRKLKCKILHELNRSILRPTSFKNPITINSRPNQQISSFQPLFVMLLFERDLIEAIITNEIPNRLYHILTHHTWWWYFHRFRPRICKWIRLQAKMKNQMKDEQLEREKEKKHPLRCEEEIFKFHSKSPLNSLLLLCWVWFVCLCVCIGAAELWGDGRQVHISI